MCFDGKVNEFEKHWTENGKMRANTSNYKCTKVPCKRASAAKASLSDVPLCVSMVSD